MKKFEQFINELKSGLGNNFTVIPHRHTEGKAAITSIKKNLNCYVVLFSELIKAYVQGSYTKLPLITLVKITAALLYFVMPFDFIPDFLPLVGFADDLAIVVWVGKAIKEELDEFEKHL